MNLNSTLMPLALPRSSWLRVHLVLRCMFSYQLVGPVTEPNILEHGYSSAKFSFVALKNFYLIRLHRTLIGILTMVVFWGVEMARGKGR